MLSDDQIERYSRNLLLKEVGSQGQEKLLAARVLCVGVGGLGGPTAYYLAAAGVGRLGLVDSDRVEINNLQRQILYSTTTVGQPKAKAAKKRLEDLNPDCHVEALQERLTEVNVLSLVTSYDVVVDGSDNFATRYLVNDACVKSKKPLVSGAILKFEGQATTILPGQGHCYRCLFPDPPDPEAVPTCHEAGILGSVAGIIGSIQATEVLKLLLHEGQPLTNRLLILNALTMTFREIPIARDPSCSVCSNHSNPFTTSVPSAISC